MTEPPQGANGPDDTGEPDAWVDDPTGDAADIAGAASPVDAVVLGSDRFQRLLRSSMLSTLLRDLPAITAAAPNGTAESAEGGTESENGAARRWVYGLLCASAATESRSTQVQDAVLRVLQACLQDPEARDEEREAAVLLLERSGNRPAINLAAARDLVDPNAWTSAPATMQLDVIRRRLDLRVDLANGDHVTTNAFQRSFWNAANENTWVSVSAPTSAGKSFIVKQWFLDAAARKTQFVGVYLVPTRALIEEVSADFGDSFPKNVAIHTMPWDATREDADKEVYVLTQERLHLLQAQRPMFAPDVIFIDEAHKFGDGSRGVLLQLVLDETVRRDAGTQVLFASPLTSNPQLLLEAAPAQAKTAPITSSMVTVNQNLLWVDRVKGKPVLMDVELVYEGDHLTVGRIELPARTTSDIERFALVAVAIGATPSARSGEVTSEVKSPAGVGGNVVYANTQAQAEDIALYVYDHLGDGADMSENADIIALQELAATAVHDSYRLIEVLGRGVAFHYGNMPLLLKAEIERLFKTGALTYLVCTSTLLEGVNLPCRNLFVRAPRKGLGNPMEPADFWNLAGRAGRWGKEFGGNIVCLDPRRKGVWAHPPRLRIAQPIERAADEPIREPASLIELILAGPTYEQGADTALYESVFNFLCGRLARGIPLAQIPGLPHDVPNAIAELEAVLEEVLEGLTVPLEVLTRHTGINPLRMNALHEFITSLDDATLTAMMLPGPAHPQAYSLYTEALNVTVEFLGGDFGNEARQFQLAMVMVNWMRGYPLARIIRERYDFYRGRNQLRPLPALIRETMGDVEKYARFEAPKYLSCYLNILTLETAARGITTPASTMDIEMMLELGVSRVTEVSLMSLGLSRASVLALSGFIDEDALTLADARTWMSELDVETLDLPVLIVREVGRIRERVTAVQTDRAD